jgi:cation transport regulator
LRQIPSKPGETDPAIGSSNHNEGTVMPKKYDKISDLPNSQVNQYDHHEKRAFLEAYNHAVDEYHDEGQAFAVAHHAAKEAGKKKHEEHAK